MEAAGIQSWFKGIFELLKGHPRSTTVGYSYGSCVDRSVHLLLNENAGCGSEREQSYVGKSTNSTVHDVVRDLASKEWPVHIHVGRTARLCSPRTSVIVDRRKICAMRAKVDQNKSGTRDVLARLGRK
jgi:hypothetical protein